jgi:hypothetical protein
MADTGRLLASYFELASGDLERYSVLRDPPDLAG